MRKSLLRIFLKFIGMLPEKGIRRLARIPLVKKAYSKFLRSYPKEVLIQIEVVPKNWTGC